MMVSATRVLIAGAGITGLLTAIQCALAGHRVTLLDRGAIPNPRCSSFDQHRAIRALDPADPGATARSAAAHRRWLELEACLGTRIYRRVGVVTAWSAQEAVAAATVAAAAGVPITRIEPDRLPNVVFPPGSVGVLEHNAGVLLAERILRAAATWLDRHPAVTVRPGQVVTAVDADRGRVELAGGEMLSADLILIAIGPWSRELVDLPLVLHRQTMVYLRPPRDLSSWWKNAPSAGRVGADGRAWLLPPGAGTLLKISTDSVCRVVDKVAEGIAGAEDRWADQVLRASILTDADRYRVVTVKHCHYMVDADTGDGNLVRIGPAVWARAASGGDGFRTAPLVADRIAAEASISSISSTEEHP